MIDSKKRNELKKLFKASLIAQHGKSNYAIRWHMDTERLFKYPTGLKGWMCFCTVSASDFKPTLYKFVYDIDDNYWKAYKQNYG